MLKTKIYWQTEDLEIEELAGYIAIKHYIMYLWYLLSSVLFILLIVCITCIFQLKNQLSINEEAAETICKEYDELRLDTYYLLHGELPLDSLKEQTIKLIKENKK